MSVQASGREAPATKISLRSFLGMSATLFSIIMKNFVVLFVPVSGLCILGLFTALVLLFDMHSYTHAHTQILLGSSDLLHQYIVTDARLDAHTRLWAHFASSLLFRHATVRAYDLRFVRCVLCVCMCCVRVCVLSPSFVNVRKSRCYLFVCLRTGACWTSQWSCQSDLSPMDLILRAVVRSTFTPCAFLFYVCVFVTHISFVCLFAFCCAFCLFNKQAVRAASDLLASPWFSAHLVDLLHHARQIQSDITLEECVVVMFLICCFVALLL